VLQLARVRRWGTFSQVLRAGIFPAGQGRRVELTPFIPARLSPLLTVNPWGGRGTLLETQVFVKPTQTLEKYQEVSHEACYIQP
jgi:hypothetical protein